jgi:two-component system chemotaxis sensor kinase CheA
MSAVGPGETFRLEAQDLLEQLEQDLLDLERAPDDASLVNSIFRSLHTLKGSGAMFGFDAAAAFTHHVESAFDQIRKGFLTPSHELVAVALEAKDHIRILIESEQPEAEDGDAILVRLREAIDGAAPTQPGGSVNWRIRFRLPENAIVTGVNPLGLLDELRELGPCTVVAQTDELPLLDELDPTSCRLSWNVLLSTEQPREAIEQVFIFVLDEMELQIEPAPPAEGAWRLGDILIARNDVAPEAVEAAAAAQAPIGALLVQAGQLSKDKLAAALGEQHHMRAEARGARKPDTVRVPAERLDDLMNRVAELVIAQSRLDQVAAASENLALKAVAEEIERIGLDLRDTMMGVRMQPIGSLFSRYRRMVRDLADELGKDIEFVTSGEETELDKTVIDQLGEPLIHLVRNALDHGIEPSAERDELGKRPRGRISLGARHSGAEVIVSIVDDGRGLDREAIRARGEARGLVAPDAVLSDQEVFQLVFEPGFSTAERVTSLSGRGVGMDVVKRTIEELRGSIALSSTTGQGTSVSLHLPLTLAIIDGLLVRVGEGCYVIPLTAVEECVELPAEVEAGAKNRNFLNIRNNLVPYLKLRELFETGAPPDPYQKIVIVSTGEQRVGLVVDEVIGEHQTVIKSLSRLHAGVGAFSGATILGDGAVALILEIPHLVAAGQPHDQFRNAPAERVGERHAAA